jgi:hypothetical protein
MRRWCCHSNHSNTVYASAPFIVFTAIADRPPQIVMLLAHPETAPGLSSSAEVCFHCFALNFTVLLPQLHSRRTQPLLMRCAQVLRASRARAKGSVDGGGGGRKDE